MSKWLPVRIGDLGRVVTGRTPPSAQPEMFSGDVPFITPSDMSEDARHIAPTRWVSRDWDRKRRQLLPEKAICVVCIGATIGKVCLTQIASHTNQQVNSIVVDASKYDADFIYYAMRLKPSELRARAAGAATPILNKSAFSDVEINCPELSDQRSIGSVLAAYDDLIEVNRRRVAVLEQVAWRLFREWFVDFRFPGSKGNSFIGSPDAPLPALWTSQRIADVAAYVNRGIPPRYNESAETLVVGQKCIRNQRLSLTQARRQSNKVPAEKLVKPGDILINSTGVGTLGRVAQAEAVPAGLTVDSHVTIVRPGEAADRDYLGMQLLQMQSVFEHLGAGSTGQTELARGSIQDQVITWPPTELRARYGQIVRPMRGLIDQLMIQNHRLAASRDLLLPRLMSGQLSVSAAEQELEAA